ncbi:MAG: hypothetical protein LUH47_06700 [Clostridiales bacterium]|nr:hypothetical protein [Clostridiales bacterium]
MGRPSLWKDIAGIKQLLTQAPYSFYDLSSNELERISRVTHTKTEGIHYGFMFGFVKGYRCFKYIEKRKKEKRGAKK